MTADAKIKALGIALPEPKPVGNYVPGVVVGNLLYLSGQGPMRGGIPTVRGKVGRDLSVDEAYQVAREVGINLLGSARYVLGSLDRVKRIVKVLGMVNSADGFGDQPKVINGFSDLMVEVFGDKGRHARSAVGMAELPMGIPVEVPIGQGARREAAPQGERRPSEALSQSRSPTPGPSRSGSTSRARAIRGPYQDRSFPSSK
jgi:enamine deaminase RidA (YjgF/YER057c/UK114 family)